MNFNYVNWRNQKFRLNSMANFVSYVTKDGAQPLQTMPTEFPSNMAYMDNAFKNTKDYAAFNAYVSRNAKTMSNAFNNANAVGKVAVPETCYNMDDAFVNSNISAIAIYPDAKCNNAFVNTNVKTICINNAIPTSIKYIKDESTVYAPHNSVVNFFTDHVIDKPNVVRYDAENLSYVEFNFDDVSRNIYFIHDEPRTYAINGLELFGNIVSDPTSIGYKGYGTCNGNMYGYSPDDPRFDLIKQIETERPTTMNSLFTGKTGSTQKYFAHPNPTLPELIYEASGTYRNFDNMYSSTSTSGAYLIGSPGYPAEKAISTNNMYVRQKLLTGSPVIHDGVVYSVGMFSQCENLSGSPVISQSCLNAEYMYEECHNLTGEPVTCDNLLNMSYMYRDCTNLTGNPSVGKNVTYALGAYIGCENLTGPPVISNVCERAESMYENCFNITGQPVVSPVQTDARNMYANCYSLTGSPVIPSSNTDISSMYANCYNLTGTPILPDYDGKSLYRAYYRCRNLTGTVNINHYYSNMSSTFGDCHNLTGANIGTKMSTTADMANAFANCYNLNISYDSLFNLVSNATSMKYLFANCRNLTGLGIIPATATGSQAYLHAYNNTNINELRVDLKPGEAGIDDIPDSVDRIIINNTLSFSGMNWENFAKNIFASTNTDKSRNIFMYANIGNNSILTYKDNNTNLFIGRLLDYQYGKGELHDNANYASGGARLVMNIPATQAATDATTILAHINYADYELYSNFCDLSTRNGREYSNSSKIFPGSLTEIKLPMSSATATTMNLDYSMVTSVSRANTVFPPVIGSNTTTAAFTYYNCYKMKGAAQFGAKLVSAPSLYENCRNLTDMDPNTSYAKYGKYGIRCNSSNVDNMALAFNECHNIHGDSLYAPNATSLKFAYANCFNLTGDAYCGPKVTDMTKAYNSCYNLTGNASVGPNVINAQWAYAFSGVTGPAVTGVNLVNAKGMYEKSNISGPITLYDKITDATNMFAECKNLKTEPVVAPNLTSVSNMYRGTAVFGNVVLPTKPSYVGSMYRGCTGNLVLPDDMVSMPSQITGMDFIFSGAVNLTGTPKFPDSTAYVYCRSAYANCRSLTGTPVLPKYINQDMRDLFCYCVNLSGDISTLFSSTNVNTGDVRIDQIVRGCNKLYGDSLSIPKNTVSTYWSFADTGLNEVNITPANAKLTSMPGMCQNCPNITNGMISGVATNIAFAYDNCQNLTDYHVCGTTSMMLPTSISNAACAFRDTNLIHVEWPTNDTGKNLYAIFAGCPVYNPSEAFPPPDYMKWDGLFASSRITECRTLPSDIPTCIDSLYAYSGVTKEVYDSRITAGTWTAGQTWFRGCNLAKFECPTMWNNMYNMYADCKSTCSPKCSAFVVNFDQAYNNCVNITGNPACGSGVTSMNDAYHNCSNLTGSPVIGQSVVNAVRAYMNCSNLTGPIVYWSDSALINTEYMFSNCIGLSCEPVVPSSVDTSNHMFDGCSNIIGNADFGTERDNVYYASYMYNACVNLTGLPETIPMNGYYEHTFDNCVNLRGVAVIPDLIYSANSMYENCHNLNGDCCINIRTLSTCYNNLFRNCLSLNNITIQMNPDMPDTTYINNIDSYFNGMFADCPSLKSMKFDNFKHLQDIFDILLTHNSSTPIICNVYYNRTQIDDKIHNGYVYEIPHSNVRHVFIDTTI